MKLKHLNILWKFPVWLVVVPFGTVAIAVLSDPPRGYGRSFDPFPLIKEMYKEMWAWMLGLPYTPSSN